MPPLHKPSPGQGKQWSDGIPCLDMAALMHHTSAFRFRFRAELGLNAFPKWSTNGSSHSRGGRCCYQFSPQAAVLAHSCSCSMQQVVSAKALRMQMPLNFALWPFPPCTPCWGILLLLYIGVIPPPPTPSPTIYLLVVEQKILAHAGLDRCTSLTTVMNMGPNSMQNPQGT